MAPELVKATTAGHDFVSLSFASIEFEVNFY